MARIRSNPAVGTYVLGALALAATGGIVYKITYARTLDEARAAREAKDAARAERVAGLMERREARVAEQAAQSAGSGQHKDATPTGGMSFGRKPSRLAGV